MKIKPILTCMRIHHWSKNLLIFFPLLTSHQIGNIDKLGISCAVLLIFSLCTSAGYLINDVIDRESDRHHVTKKFRPVAAGELSVRHALWIAGGLVGVNLILSSMISISFTILLVIYLGLLGLYSGYFKRVQIVDLFCLTGFYIVRILIGLVIAPIDFSYWLLGFSCFFFLSLTCIKRSAELRQLSGGPTQIAIGRSYCVTDKPAIDSLGIANGFCAVVTLMLYISTPQAMTLYRHPQYLWLVCFCLLYWIMRIWFKSNRGDIGEDPVTFVIRDGVSYGIFAISLVVIALSI